MKWLVIVVLAGSACSGLPAIEPEVCGNNILELDRGEDCDGSPGCTPTCQILCGGAGPAQEPVDDDSELVECDGLRGYVCGADDLCHRPSGQFEVAGVGSFASREAIIADINVDGIGDLVGATSASLDVLLGNQGLDFSTTTSVRTPALQGAFALANLTDDPVPGLATPTPPKIVIPTTDGLVSYSAASGALAAEPFPADLAGGDGLAIKALIAIDPVDPTRPEARKRFGAFGPETTSDSRLEFEVIDAALGEGVAAWVVCDDVGVSAERFRPELVESYTVVHTATRLEMVFVVGLPDPAQPRTCAFSMVYDAGPTPQDDTYRFTHLAIPLAVGASRPVLIDLEGDSCPELVTREASGGVHPYAVGALNPPLPSTPSSRCELTVSKDLQIPGLTMGAVAVGRLRLAPKISGAAPEALVFDTGIFEVREASGTLSTRLLHRADRPIARVFTGDLDRDGGVDAVVTSRDVRDLDVLFRARSTGGSPELHGFLPTRIITQGIPTSGVLGDFDANGFLDILYGERFGETERLNVAFGTSDRLLEPVHVANFSHIISFSPLHVPDSNDPTDIVQDVAVLDLEAGRTRLVALHGGRARTMTPVFSPGFGTAERMHSVVAGDLDGDQRTDLIAIDLDKVANGGTIFQLFGQAAGGLRPGPLLRSEIDDCSPPGPSLPPTTLTPVCASARHVIVEQKVFSIDPAGSVLRMDLSSDLRECSMVEPTLCPTPKLTKVATERAHPIVPHEPFGFDIDHDAAGAQEVILAFSNPAVGSEPAGAVLVCDAELDQACEDVLGHVQAVDASVVSCLDAASGVVSAGTADLIPQAELVVMCRGAFSMLLFRVARSAGSYKVEPFATVELDSFEPRTLQIGDVTGDAIDDLVLIGERDGDIGLAVLRQLAPSEVGLFQGDGTGAR